MVIFALKRQKQKKKAFTLVELLVSIGIFSLVFGTTASLYVANLKAQRKYLALQQLLSEAGYVMSYMSSQLERGLRDEESNCPGGCLSGLPRAYEETSYGVRFISHRGECVEFFSTSTPGEPGPRLYQQVGCPPFALVPGHLTPVGLEVEEFNVYVTHPTSRVTLYLKIKTTGKDSSSVELQTTVSKRKLYVP